MVYLKLILDDRKSKQDKIYSVIVRITFNRKSSTISTGVRVEKEFWDQNAGRISTSHPNNLGLNTKISQFFLNVQKVVLNLEASGAFSIENLKHQLADKPEVKCTKQPISFNSFTMSLIAEMLSINKTGNALVYETAANRILKYVGVKVLYFSHIDYTLLDGFKHSLIKDQVKQNTISNYFRTLRAIYNKAIKAKLIDRASYPFLDVSFKAERTSKRAVDVKDLKFVCNYSISTDSREWHSRNYFFLSFALIGMSFTDLAYLTPTNVYKGRIIYKRRKTHKEYNIKLTPLALRILEVYKGKSSKYLLPILSNSVIEDSTEAKKLIRQWIKTTNKWINKLGEKCKVDGNLTTYVARHTWATTAKRLGYSNELIAEAMGHEYGNKITNIYLDTFDQSVIDDLNEKVQSFI